MRKTLLGALSVVLVLFLVLAGCESPTHSGNVAAALAQRQAAYAEPPGDYYIGRRYFNPNYKFWGYVRKPGESWKSAQLVMLNEKQKLAPDRATNQPGSDDNYQYRLYGHFTGESVYEPVSNRVLPEFLLTGYTLVDAHPASIFPPNAALPSTAIIHPN